MEGRAEINRFAVFLFCLLVPLGSMAPTESKMTTGQNHFTPEIPTLAVIIQQKAQKLFESYHKCISATFHPEPCRGTSKGRELAERIPKCAAFQADCCALHHILTALQTQRSHIETLCTRSSTPLVETNLSQLNTTLSQGSAFYTCSSQGLPQVDPQTQSMGWADRKTYIWWVLKNYKDIMKFTANLYTEV